VSKFRVITGDNVTSIAAQAGEIKQLEFEIQRKVDPTDKDYVVYAYHFTRLGHHLLAQKYLNRVSNHYFDNGIYRDLSQALLMWSVVQEVPMLKDKPGVAASYEYFIILRRAVKMFPDVEFQTKPEFTRFAKDFARFTTIPKPE
jgi:hypothetical protein